MLIMVISALGWLHLETNAVISFLNTVLPAQIMELFSAINDQKITIVVVTHEKELVDTYNKRVITINHGVLVNDRKGGYDI